MKRSVGNQVMIIFQIQAFVQGILLVQVQAAVRSESKKLSNNNLKYEEELKMSSKTQEDLLYYLPTESVSESKHNPIASATSPPHVTIDPASVHSISESTMDAFDLHESDEYIIPYASQCVSDFPSNFEEEYFSELLTPSKNLVQEPILSGHIEVASKTSNEDKSKDFNRPSGSSVLEGSHIYMPSITLSE